MLAFVRYLTRNQTLGAPRRCRPVEQFLGPLIYGNVPGIRWVAVTPIH